MVILQLGCFYFTASILLDYLLYIFVEGRSPHATFINTLVPPDVFSYFKQYFVWWLYSATSPRWWNLQYLQDEVRWIWQGNGAQGAGVSHPSDGCQWPWGHQSLYLAAAAGSGHNPVCKHTQRCRNMLDSTRLKTLLAFIKLLLSYTDFYQDLLLFTDVSNTAVLSKWQ